MNPSSFMAREHWAVLLALTHKHPITMEEGARLYRECFALLTNQPAEPGHQPNTTGMFTSRLVAEGAVLAVVTHQKTGIFVQLAVPGPDIFSSGPVKLTKPLLITVGQKWAIEQQQDSQRRVLYY